MDFENKKIIIGSLVIVLFVLCCISAVYSIEIVNDNKYYNNTSVKNNDTIKYNGTYYIEMNNTGKAIKNETVKLKPIYDTVTITAKPSCGCNYRHPNKYKYKWYTKTFVNYCPKCHKYGTLRNVHKSTAKYEYELTCDMRLGGCDADYCGVCGKDKFSWSNYRIQLVN